MKVLLLGGTGCISGDIAALAAQKSGVELYLLNRGNRPKFIPPGAHCIQADISKPDEVRGSIQGMDFDVVADFLSYGVPQLNSNFGEKLIFFSNNSILDSRKVRALVPEFVCVTRFAEGIRRTIQFYHDNPEFQVVHEEFDRKMDEIAGKYHAKTF